MFNLIKKISKNEKLISFLVFMGCAVVLLDLLSGFQGTTTQSSDTWHHRAVLIALGENPINPSNPHILSNEGSRSFIPIYVLIGFFASLIGFSADISLGVAGIINLVLLIVGAKYFAKSIGSNNYFLLLFILFFAWLDPPNYTGFHNLRSIVHTNAYPAVHSFGLTLIIWGLFIETIKKTDFQLDRWILITALMILNVLSHQFTALFCITALSMFIFIPSFGYISSTLKLIVVVVISIIASLLWPYYDLITVLYSASSGGWEFEGWFYDPRTVLQITLPTLLGLIFLIQFRHLRLMKVMGICVLGYFITYIGTSFLGIVAGHRLLPYWIFFLQIILFIALQPELVGKTKTIFMKFIKPTFICSIMFLAVAQSFIAIIDIYRPTLRYQYGWTSLKHEAEFYFEAVEKITDSLPENSILVVNHFTAFPIQGVGIPVVSIPRQAPMIADLAERQAATLKFFSPDISCEERLLTVKPYGATHAAYSIIEYVGENIDKNTQRQLYELGENINYDNLISVVKLPDQCPNN